MNYDFVRLAFADKLKQAVANLYDIDPNLMEKFKRFGYVTVGIDLGDESLNRTFTGRHAMQRFGTEMGRKTFGSDFWVELLEKDFNAIVNEHVVITDVRFDNEARWIHKQAGYLVEITRPGFEGDQHASEAGIDEDLIDCLVTNSGTIEDLYDDIDGLIKEIRSGNYA